MNNNHVTADRVSQFLLGRYADQIRGLGLDPARVPDSFDFLLTGVVDSFGVLEMVGALETEFGVELDMAALDAEQMTVLGPLVQYVVTHASRRQNGQNAPPAPH